MNYESLKLDVYSAIKKKGLNFTKIENEIGLPNSFISRYINGRLSSKQYVLVPNLLKFLEFDFKNVQKAQTEKETNISLTIDTKHTLTVDTEILSRCFSDILLKLQNNKNNMSLDKIIKLLCSYYQYSLDNKEGHLDHFLLSR